LKVDWVIEEVNNTKMLLLKHTRTAALTSWLFVYAFLSTAQDLGQLGVKKGVKVNGGINLNAVGYYVHGIEQRRDPFNWFATGNLNINLFGYAVPLSFSYSNANRSFSQPFNQFTLSPQYKWVKTYIGYNAMTFSSYTLSGHVFLGGGVELTPGRWRVAAMYGRLRKAVPFNPSDTLQNFNAAYKRMGYGVKLGYDHNGDVASISFFTAKDDTTSIPFTLPEVELTPKQNIAVSVTARKRLLKRLFIDVEYAVSALNNDIRSTGEGDSVAVRASSNFVKGLLPENATSRYYDAFNTSIGYQGNWYSVQVKYERVAPEYQTLGAYFFNNDMENVTLVPSVRLLQNRLTLGGNVGIQNNNLDDARASTTRRNVGALNASFVPNEKWNFTSNYSNFTTFTNVRPQQDPFFQNQLDTLNFYQVNQTFGASIMRNLGGKENPQSIMVNGSYQKASDEATYLESDQDSDFLSANASYSYSIVPAHTTLSLSVNFYTNNAAGITTNFWGPTVNVGRSFLEKALKISLALSYNETSGDTIQASPLMNNRLNLSYSPSAKGQSTRNNFSLSINSLRKFEGTEQQPAFTEFTGTVNYNYAF
jgi:hypothetical protein